MPRTTDAPERAIQAAEHLFCTQGYAATGLIQIIEVSGSPKGSFYFHFPGGKRELALATIAAYRARTSAGFRALAEHAAGDPDKFVRVLSRTIADEMATSGWAKGCLAQTLALELAPADAEVADAVAALFDDWVDIIVAATRASGPPRKVRRRALALLAALEGARALARVQRSAAAFEAVANEFRMTD